MYPNYQQPNQQPYHNPYPAQQYGQYYQPQYAPHQPQYAPRVHPQYQQHYQPPLPPNQPQLQRVPSNQQLQGVPSNQQLQRIPSNQQLQQLPNQHQLTHRVPSNQQPPTNQPYPVAYNRHVSSYSVPYAALPVSHFAPPPPSHSAIQAVSIGPSPTLPPPKRSGSLPPGPPQFPQILRSPEPSPSPPNPATKRPLPTPSKHQSIDLSRFSGNKTRSPSPVKRINGIDIPVKRRASPPRFNSSPTKDDISPLPPKKPALPPLETQPGQKFVPLWKRSSTTPTPGPRPGSESPTKRPLPTPAPAKSPYSIPTRKVSLHKRVPARTSTYPGEADVEDENSDTDLDDEIEPPSPQYGIRDLPKRSDSVLQPTVTSPSRSLPQPGAGSSPFGSSRSSGLPKPPTMTVSRSDMGPGSVSSVSRFGSTSDMGSNTSRNSSNGLPQPPALSRFTSRSEPGESGTQTSMTLKFATMSMDSPSASSSSRPGSKFGQRGQDQWPSDLPRLPQTPTSPRKLPFSSREKNLDLDDPPPASWTQSGGGIRRSQSRRSHTPGFGSGSPSLQSPSPVPAPAPIPAMSAVQVVVPTVQIESPKPLGGRDRMADIPKISLPQEDQETDDEGTGPQIRITVDEEDKPKKKSPVIFEVPGISLDSGSSSSVPRIALPSSPSSSPPKSNSRPLPPARGGGLRCAGCSLAIIGKIISVPSSSGKGPSKWHPSCFKCEVCGTLLEHVSAYEWEGRVFCHLDYHENFAPKCYHCQTSIIDERFISLDDPNLGKRTYHEQHFFCSECGDPFMDPSKSSTFRSSSKGEIAFSGDGVFADDDVGFVVYKGYPYCEACHVRLRLPKCKKCGKSIRDWQEAVEALGGKWCYECFVCASCEKPFENPSFFQRDNKPYCQDCFSIILRNEI